MQPYTFDMTLQPQILSASHTTVASITLGGNALGVVKPIASVQNIASPAASSFGAGFTDFGFAVAHRLSDLTASAGWISQYDAYRINYVTVIMEYLTNTTTPAALVALPTVYYYMDQDDATPPNASFLLYSKQGVQSWQPTSGDTTLSFRYRPRLAAAVGSADVPSALIMKAGQWLNCNNPNVDHCALKMVVTDFLSPGLPNFTHGFRVSFKYNISFRSPLQCY